MHHTRTGLVLAYHGCDKTIADKIISTSNKNLRQSNNSYDWLGHGIYFWENSYSRALAYAKALKKHPERVKSKIIRPAVIGVVLDLGHCLNLLDHDNLELVKSAYTEMSESFKKTKIELPQNTLSKDLLLRKLDCAVIEYLHTTYQEESIRPFDSVRGVFSEGESLYPNAGFRAKDHIQICVRNPNCIKGYFHPRKPNNSFSRV